MGGRGNWLMRNPPIPGSSRRLLLVFPYFLPPQGSNSNGVKSVLLSLLAGLDRARFHPYLLAPAPTPHDRDFIEAGADMLYLGEPRHLILERKWNPGYLAGYFGLRSPRYLARSIGVIRRHRIELVHSHGSSFLAAALAARLLGVPSLIHLHETGLTIPRPISKLYNGAVLLSGHRVVALGHYLRPSFSHLPGAGSKIAVIHNGIDLSRFRPESRGEQFRRELGLPERVPLAGYLGRLDPRKQVEDFIQAAALALARLPEARFVVVGDVVEPDKLGYKQGLWKLAGRLNLGERLIFAGSRGQVPQVLAALDLLVLPSRAEPFATVLLEAAAAGRPVVATAAGGTPEIVQDGVTGRLAPVGRPEALAQAMVHLLSDRELTARMGAAARERAESMFDQRRFADEVMNLYREILDGWSRSSTAGAPREERVKANVNS